MERTTQLAGWMRYKILTGDNIFSNERYIMQAIIMWLTPVQRKYMTEADSQHKRLRLLLNIHKFKKRK